MSGSSSSVADILSSLGITALAGEIVLGGVRPLSTSVDVPAPLLNLMVIDTGATSQTTATATLQTTATALTVASGVQGTVSTSDGGRSITFAGTLDQINADLTRLSYLSAAAGNDTVTLSVTDTAGNTNSDSFAVSVLPTTTNPGAPTTGSYVQTTSSGQNATLSGGNQIYTADNKTDIVVASGVSSSVTGGSAGSSLTLVQDGGSYDFTNKGGSTLMVADAAPGTIHGGAAGSRLVAFLQSQPTTYIGGYGNDELIGGSGNMTVMLGHGADSFVGGSGAATVAIGSGNADLFAGSGAELFSFQAGRTGGSDVISGFRVGADHLRLSGGLAVAGSSSAGGMTSIRLTDGTQIHLAGISGVPQASLFG